MISISIKPVDILGECPAGIAQEDEIRISGMRLENPNGNNVCFLSVSHFPMMVWQLQSKSRFFSHVSCPGCTLNVDEENRVVFLLAHEDKMELSLLISAYLRQSKSVEEPQMAKQLKGEAIELQNQGNYPDATDKMKAALRLLTEGIEI